MGRNGGRFHMRKKVKIQDGKIAIGRDAVAEMIRNANDGYYAVALKKWDRTIEQNNYYWLCLGIIGNELGYHKNELHEEFIRMFSPTITRRTLEGKPKQDKLRTSEMNIKQMTNHIEQVIQFAAENSIRLPEPETED